MEAVMPHVLQWNPFNLLNIGATEADHGYTTRKPDAATSGTGAKTAGEGGRKAEDLQQTTEARRRLGMRPGHRRWT